MITVVIPNYNNLKYLPACLESVLTQTFTDIEVVVVDDGSTDGSREWLRERVTTDSRLRLIENEQNVGVVKTRDRGIREASHEYVTTLDSDDYYYDSEKLAREVALLKQALQTNGESVMPFSNTLHVDNEGRVLKREVSEDNLREGWIFSELLLRRCAVPRDFIFSRAHYFQVQGFDPGIPIYEDWDLKLRLSRLARFVYTGAEGVAYRQTGQGLSTTGIFRHLRWKNHVFKKNNPMHQHWRRQFQAALLFRLKLLRELLGAMRDVMFPPKAKA
jgi:glycosyltransferase involved in cell wall biosynthesis